METAKLFMSGNSQAVRLPKQYRFSGDEEGYAQMIAATAQKISRRLGYDEAPARAAARDSEAGRRERAARDDTRRARATNNAGHRTGNAATEAQETA